MFLKGIFKNSYFYLFLGCMGILGSLGITLAIAEKATSAPLAEPLTEAYPGIVRPDY